VRGAADSRDGSRGEGGVSWVRPEWMPGGKLPADAAHCPQYPVYIPSKGRWGRQALTVRALERLGMDYRVVVEPQEVPQYQETVPPGKLLVLPQGNLGLGSIPARNFIWDHAQAAGAARHWVLDDNLMKFYRLHDSRRLYARSAAIFRAAEDFVDRYENVVLAGFNYSNFAHERLSPPPFRLNTRIYSCILIETAAPYRWRGRYNEDTDLSLRVLKDGHCTVLFNAFLCDKTGTMRMKGGNTDQLYAGSGRLEMAESLRVQHPDVVHVTVKWGRAQHHVDYRPFAQQRLRLRPGVKVPEHAQEYGMVLRPLAD
jgi:hypothetical protein